jgi:hypothetical protein
VISANNDLVIALNTTVTTLSDGTPNSSTGSGKGSNNSGSGSTGGTNNAPKKLYCN